MNKKKLLGWKLKDERLKRGKESKTSKDRKRKRRDKPSLGRPKTLSTEHMSYILRNKNLKSKGFKSEKPFMKSMMRSAKSKPQWTTQPTLAIVSTEDAGS